MEDKLQSLGLSPNEAKIYFFLVKNGRASVSEIARSIGANRRNVYDALHRVLERGLVFKVHHSRESIYEAVNPQKLSELVREKERILETILPQLKEFYASDSEDEEVCIYKGEQGFKNSMSDIIEVGEDVYTIGAKGFWFDQRIEGFTLSFLEEAEKLGIGFHHIFDEDVRSEFPQVLDTIPKPHKFFPAKFATQACVIIFGNRVVTFTGVGPGELSQDITVFVQISRSVANSYKKWFNCLWELLPNQ